MQAGAATAGAGEGLKVGTRIAVRWDHGWEEGLVTAGRALPLTVTVTVTLSTNH